MYAGKRKPKTEQLDCRYGIQALSGLSFIQSVIDIYSEMSQKLRLISFYFDDVILKS